MKKLGQNAQDVKTKDTPSKTRAKTYNKTISANTPNSCKYKITLDAIKINIFYEISTRVKHIKIIIVDKNNIKVRFNKKLSENKIKNVVLKHKKWILKTLPKLGKKINLSKKILFLGQIYKVKIDTNSNEICKIDEPLKLYILNKNYTLPQQKEILKNFYKMRAQQILQNEIKSVSKKTKLNAKKISFRYAVSRWGSCSADNNISLNYMMMQFDISFANYVILHEFCHILHKNHSKNFWDMVGSFMRDYKEIIKQTKAKPTMNII